MERKFNKRLYVLKLLRRQNGQQSDLKCVRSAIFYLQKFKNFQLYVHYIYDNALAEQIVDSLKLSLIFGLICALK